MCREGEPFLYSNPSAYLQMGICIGLSSVPTKRPASLRAATTATLAWNRFLPYGWCQTSPVLKPCTTNLESFSSVGIEGSVVVEDVDERKAMTDPNLIIVSIVCRGNLDSSSTELHVDDDGVRDDWNSAINERMDGKFSVKMLRLGETSDAKRGFTGTYRVPRVVRMDCNCGISKHGLRSGSGDDDFFVCEGV